MLLFELLLLSNVLNVFDIYHLDKEKNVHIVELHLYLYLHLPNEVFQQSNHQLKSILIDKNCSINQKQNKKKKGEFSL